VRTIGLLGDHVSDQIPASHRDLAECPPVAALSTVTPGGYPQTSVVWSDFDDQCLRVNTMRGSRCRKCHPSCGTSPTGPPWAPRYRPCRPPYRLSSRPVTNRAVRHGVVGALQATRTRAARVAGVVTVQSETCIASSLIASHLVTNPQAGGHGTRHEARRTRSFTCAIETQSSRKARLAPAGGHDRTGHGCGHRAMRSRTTFRQASLPVSGIGMPKLWAYTSSRGTAVASTS
jgi:hypothetical protein